MESRQELKPERKPALRPAAPVHLASLSPNQIVSMRGLWDDAEPQAPAPAMVAIAETNALSVSSERRLQPHRPRRDRQRRPVPDAGSGARRRSTRLRRAGGRSQSAGRHQACRARARRCHQQRRGLDRQQAGRDRSPGHQTRPAERLDDPWTRGVLLTASLQNSLVVTPVGDTDFAGLAQFMKKPISAVLMTFSDDPHLGMTDGAVHGHAVVFPATVTFGASRRSASLQ